LALLIPGLVIFKCPDGRRSCDRGRARPAHSGLRRSAHLVRRHFWSAALLASVPQFGPARVESALPVPHGVLAVLEVLAVRGIAVAPVEAAMGLVLAALSYRLIDLDATWARHWPRTSRESVRAAVRGAECPPPGPGIAG